jgi:mono/diheme cytochrome c family protein
MPQAWPLVPVVAALAALLAGLPTEGRPEGPASPTGRRATYQTYCAVCHGVDGKGDGVLTDRLRVAPPDLTLLARRNKGSFPKDMVYRIVDGRSPVKGHGGPDMPVWGDAFKEPGEQYSEDRVRAKIEGLVEYLASIQVR